MSGSTVSAPSSSARVPMSHNANHRSRTICHYFQRGICRFGEMCRFSHNLDGADVIGSTTTTSGTNPTSNVEAIAGQHKPCSSKFAVANWVNAPVFVPNPQRQLEPQQEEQHEVEGAGATSSGNKSWAEVAGAGGNNKIKASDKETRYLEEVCPYENPCPYNVFCMYALHWELCNMCDQYCLHPSDQNQRRKHNQECLQQHERDMELSFAIARSKDKTCGICFDTIMEKSGREKRFGILPNCSHIFCLECIRKWRQAKQFEHKITRSCPECRVASDFVCPSAFWVETKEDKDKLLTDYRSALGIKDCKYFKKGDGKCPFGNKCFYKHALPNGDLVDVGCPRRARKVQRDTDDDELLDLLDIYLWQYVDQRDYHWLEVFGSDDSDNSDD